MVDEIPTTDEVIDFALTALEEVRPAVALLDTFEPQAAAVVGPAITLLYEGLVAIRSARAGNDSDALKSALRAKVTESIQELAKARFESMAPPVEG